MIPLSHVEWPSQTVPSLSQFKCVTWIKIIIIFKVHYELPVWGFNTFSMDPRSPKQPELHEKREYPFCYIISCMFKNFGHHAWWKIRTRHSRFGYVLHFFSSRCSNILYKTHFSIYKQSASSTLRTQYLLNNPTFLYESNGWWQWTLLLHTSKSNTYIASRQNSWTV